MSVTLVHGTKPIEHLRAGTVREENFGEDFDLDRLVSVDLYDTKMNNTIGLRNDFGVG